MPSRSGSTTSTLGVCGAGDPLDGADQAVAAGLVVVEGQGDRLDAVLREAGEALGLDARCTDGCDVREAVGAEVVDVEQAFDEDVARRAARRSFRTSESPYGGRPDLPAPRR